jgi:hypothetical protein
MWRGYSFGFHLGFSPFGFYFGGPFPSREEYLRFLQDYKEDLQTELRRVEREIERVRKE